MSAQVFRKFRQDSLMNEFDNIINEMDGELVSPSNDIEEVLELPQRPTTLDGISGSHDPSEMLPPPPPPPPSLEAVSSPTFPPPSPSSLEAVSSPTLPPPPPPSLEAVSSPTLPPPPLSALEAVSSPTLPQPPPPSLEAVSSPTLPPPPLPLLEAVSSPTLPPPPPLPSLEAVSSPTSPPPLPPSHLLEELESPTLPPPPLVDESPTNSVLPPPPSLLTEIRTPSPPPPPLSEEGMFSPESVFPDIPSDVSSPLSHDPPPPDMFTSDNNEEVDEDNEEAAATIEVVEDSASDDDFDFTDADFAIDKMLDDLKDFSLELGVDLPENKRGDFVMLSPTHEQPEPPSFDHTNVDHFRFSIANFEDAMEVDLDALLEDLCSMEKEMLQAVPASPHARHHEHVKNGHGTVPVDSPLLNNNSNEITLLAPFTPSSPTQKPSSPVMVTHEVKERLEILQTELESKELSPLEQEEKIKAEKMRIALEKMKEASFQKLFIKVYNNELQTNKTMMIDQTWTARDVKNKMMLKDNVEQGPNWCILEKLPELFMERILEDNEYVLQTVLDWARETENALVFLNRRDKYMLFRNPQNFLLTEDHSTEDAKLVEQSKEVLLKEFFTKDSTHIPNTEGVLWLREGSRRWSKHYFALRASGLYYNPKGKQKSRDMVCLASIEHNHVYLGVGFKKKFKAPTDHVFCLKHPKVQTIKSKHIHSLCAEDAKTKEHWVTVIRMAKYGYSMYEDYLQTQEQLETALMAGSMATLTRDSVAEFSGCLTTLPAFSSESSSTLRKQNSVQNKKFGTERKKNIKKTSTGAPNRVAGKPNALGNIFSTAWSKGVEDKQADYPPSSFSCIPESPWSPHHTPAYKPGEFDFNPIIAWNQQQQGNIHEERLDCSNKNNNVESSVDCLLDTLSENLSSSNSSSQDISELPPPLTTEEKSLPTTTSNNNCEASLSSPPPTPPPCPQTTPFGVRRQPSSVKPGKGKTLQLNIPPPPPPTPPDKSFSSVEL